jgi:hypothetical protein
MGAVMPAPARGGVPLLAPAAPSFRLNGLDSIVRDFLVAATAARRCGLRPPPSSSCSRRASCSSVSPLGRQKVLAAVSTVPCYALRACATHHRLVRLDLVRHRALCGGPLSPDGDGHIGVHGLIVLVGCHLGQRGQRALHRPLQLILALCEARARVRLDLRPQHRRRQRVQVARPHQLCPFPPHARQTPHRAPAPALACPVPSTRRCSSSAERVAIGRGETSAPQNGRVPAVVRPQRRGARTGAHGGGECCVWRPGRPGVALGHCATRRCQDTPAGTVPSPRNAHDHLPLRDQLTGPTPRTDTAARRRAGPARATHLCGRGACFWSHSARRRRAGTRHTHRLLG